MRYQTNNPPLKIARTALVLGGLLLSSDALAQRLIEAAPSPTAPVSSGAVLSSSVGKSAAQKVAPPSTSASRIIEQIANSGRRTSLEVITPRAQAHIDYALDLAQRGAVDSAQAEFRTALELVADALDADTNNTARAHARAAKAGLTAIAEAKDFVTTDSVYDVEINLSQFATIHRTPVLKELDATKLTRATALQRYHSFATTQLAFAGGHSEIASSALYGLGRAESTTTAGSGVHNPLGGPNAIAFYQASLIVNPQNYIASNELGVLMARYGDLSAAQEQFIHSLTVHPQPETWHNLAAVLRANGQNDKAAQADLEREKLIAANRENGSATVGTNGVPTRPMVQWVEPEAFAATSTPYGLDGPAIDSSTPGKAAAPQTGSIGTRMIAKLTSWPRSSKTAPPSAKPTPQAESSPGTHVAERPMYR